MEDRHSISEPRPLPGLELPAWEVDILREGVDTPIMTITVDNKTLPPRKRKKKIVWKLPDNINNTPKFGTEDKKRILEIFKERKKELRKQRKSSIVSPNFGDSETAIAAAAAAAAVAEETLSDTAAEETDEVIAPPLPPPGITHDNKTEFGAGEGPGGVPSPKPRKGPQQPPGVLKRSGSRFAGDSNGTNGNHVPKQSSSPPPPGFQMSTLSISADTLSEEKQTKHPPSQPKHSTGPPAHSLETSIDTNPPLLASRTQAPAAPSKNGFHLHQSTQQQSPPNSDGAPPGMSQNDSLRQNSAEPPPLNSSNGQNNDNTSLMGGGAANNPSTTTLRQFTVPPNSTLAQVVAQTYYMLLANGLVHDLALHYSPTAQKSCTVGGAHAVCQKPEEREQQLRSLVGIVVQIKGILQQPTAANGTLVLITGTCVQPHALPFCHSLVLVPTVNALTTSGIDPLAVGGYQIQNDALCFLSPEG